MKIAALLLAAAGAMPAVATPVPRSHASMAETFGDGMAADITRASLSLSGHDNPGSPADDAPAPDDAVCPLPGQREVVDKAPASASEPEPGPEPSAPRLIFAALAAIAWTVGRRLKS